ncbi:MAG: NUDIX hydrolase [Xanthomonadales bacterium]|jgi:8-oxo-dGTP pyrophosphatase MutT (NUDIX family)|nr:NUDIX hydrolase [Xanthomonadales bacterium]
MVRPSASFGDPYTIPALSAALTAHAAQRPEAAPVVARMLDFLRRHAEAAFRRETAEGHFCGSAWIVDCTEAAASQQRVLLTHHRKLNRWLQLGGHADGNPDLRAVALIEAREESGLHTLHLQPEIFDVDIHEIPARPGEPAHLHLDVRYVIRANATEALWVSNESHALAWVPVSTLLTADAEASIRRMARYWCETAA